MPRDRPLLDVPCDTHGAGPCPSPGGCANRRTRAGLRPKKSGATGAERVRKAAEASPWKPGQAVIWDHVPRGGYGYPVPVRGRVVQATGARVRILILRIQTINGDRCHFPCERLVRPENLKPAPDPLPQDWPAELRP